MLPGYAVIYVHVDKISVVDPGLRWGAKVHNWGQRGQRSCLVHIFIRER